MGAQVHHGAAAGLHLVVKVGRQPAQRAVGLGCHAAVVVVVHPGVGDLAQLAAFHQRPLAAFRAGAALVGVGDGKGDAALPDGLGNLLGVFVGEGPAPSR